MAVPQVCERQSPSWCSVSRASSPSQPCSMDVFIRTPVQFHAVWPEPAASPGRDTTCICDRDVRAGMEEGALADSDKGARWVTCSTMALLLDTQERSCECGTFREHEGDLITSGRVHSWYHSLVVPRCGGTKHHQLHVCVVRVSSEQTWYP